MELSAWTVYWVMQADSIRIGVFPVAVVLSVVSAALFAFVLLAIHEKPTRGWWAVPATALLGFAWLVLLPFSILMPTTKTLAAALVIPAISNNEAVQSEAGELYDLAKEALSEAIGVEPNKDDE